MKKILLHAVIILIGITANAQSILEVDASEEGKAISQTLMGAFFEDINYGADGGLYAELVQNRSFEYFPVSGYTNLQPLDFWQKVIEGGAQANMSIDNTHPLNANNTNYLKLEITNPGTFVGVRNTGFNGIAVDANAKYDFSVYAKSEADFNHPLIVQIIETSGEILSSDTIFNITTAWSKYELTLTSSAKVSNSNLRIVTNGSGTIYFDMVSLFPQDTYKGRKNGLRKDLAEAIADMEPQFLRFPGGCISHGRGLDNAYRWKETVRDVAERKPNWNLWGYHQTYGLGFYEYFLFSEDMNAIPLPVIPVGVSCQFRDREIEPIENMGPWIDDALDLIEFANGTTDTEWGKLRADMGHPEPFNMEYLCLGNEEDDIPEFRERFMMIVDTLRKYHPEIKIIGTSGTDDAGSYYNSLWEFSHQENLDAVDEHYYNDPDWFLNNVHRYDNFDREGPKVFIGEYASRDDRLGNAIAEAAYLTGVERNADIIEFACYAPLLCNESNNQWHPDLIRFSNTRVAKTASYYVQQLYSVHSGDTYINSTVSYQPDFNYTTNSYTGRIGVGTWDTQAEFDDIKVESNGTVLFEEDFSSGATNWEVASGTFSANSGVYSQSSGGTPAWSNYKYNIEATEYTVTLKAKKTGGAEGFLIPFGFSSTQSYYWLNIGGWANTQHAVEKGSGNSKSQVVTTGGSIETNKWYTIKMDISPEEAIFYLDDKLIFSIPAPTGPVTASVTKDIDNNELIIKMVNSSNSDLTSQFNIKGQDISQQVNVITLTGSSSNSRNSISAPKIVVPKESTAIVTNTSEYTLPANSLQVFRIKLGEEFQDFTSLETMDEKKSNALRIQPNPMNDFTYIQLNNPDGKDFSLSVLDLSGKEHLRKQGKSDNIEVHKSELTAGTYIVQLKINGQVYSEKMVVN